jgi:hypothetical protein
MTQACQPGVSVGDHENCPKRPDFLSASREMLALSGPGKSGRMNPKMRQKSSLQLPEEVRQLASAFL